MNKAFDEENLPVIEEPEYNLNVSLDEITKEEIIKVLKQLKRWKAPGPDGLTAEMFMADMDVLLEYC